MLSGHFSSAYSLSIGEFCYSSPHFPPQYACINAVLIPFLLFVITSFGFSLAKYLQAVQSGGAGQSSESGTMFYTSLSP